MLLSSCHAEAGSGRFLGKACLKLRAARSGLVGRFHCGIEKSIYAAAAEFDRNARVAETLDYLLFQPGCALLDARRFTWHLCSRRSRIGGHSA
jgi:hypothetical protein